MTLLKIDENLPVEVADLLNAAGHDAMTIVQQNMAGDPDTNAAAVCRREGRAVVTLDLDFADIRTYPPADYPGIIILRAVDQSKDAVLDLVRSLVAALATEEPLEGHLWIVRDGGLRIR